MIVDFVKTFSLSDGDRELIKDTRERLSDSVEGLAFDSQSHTYKLNGRELESVSSIVEEYAPFDAEKTAANCAVNPKSKYFGMPVQEILNIWNDTAKAAAESGTDVHNYAEYCFNVAVGNEEEMPVNEGSDAVVAKKSALAQWWRNLDESRFIPIASETMVANPELGYAGTFDLLLYDKSSGGYVLCDYKTNADLFKWYGNMLKPPCDVLQDSPVGRYTVQQTLYRMQLENISLNVTSMMLIWLKEDGSYQEVELNMRYDKLMRYALQMRRQNKTN